MTIRVLINGAFGRMGQMISRVISEDARFELVGQTGREYDLKKSIQDSNAQVVIDFTHPEVVFKNALAIIEAGACPVIGTSGLKTDEIEKLLAECAEKKIGGVIAPNFSLGAVLMMKYAKEIAKYIPRAEIIEYHHDNKADSPSGTSLRTAEMIGSVIKDKQAEPKTFRETVPGSRGAIHCGVPIHAVRLPGLLAHQEVIFGETGETLTIRHDSIDRISFAPGICFACEKVVTVDKMVYGLEELL